MHDYAHKGLTNDFIISTRDPLALLYNDQSPMENHHLCASFEIIHCHGIIQHLDKATQQTIRKRIIDLILSTDMSKHLGLVSKFHSAHSSRSSNSPQDQEIQRRVSLSDIDNNLATTILLKLADIGHLASQQHVHEKWVGRLEEEFFNQGDKERGLNIEITPLFDRTKKGISKSQIGFFEIVALPIANVFTEVFPGCITYYENMKKNYAYWQSL